MCWESSVKKTIMLETISAADFAEHAGSECRVVLDDGSEVNLTLESVEEGPDQGGMLEQFIVLFRGAKDRYLPQGIYKVKHTALGTLDLFLIPTMSMDANMHAYQVCFSRLANPAGGQ